MLEDAISFWTDIQRYEDMLVADPNSHCFAQLAELYRKLGLLDDAISVARKGCELHPDFSKGFFALGNACYAKGLIFEARRALERVLSLSPGDLPTKKILGQLYVEAGEILLAKSVLGEVLKQNPDDTESLLLLRSIASTDVTPRVYQEPPEDVEDIEELTEVLDEPLAPEYELPSPPFGSAEEPSKSWEIPSFEEPEEPYATEPVEKSASQDRFRAFDEIEDFEEIEEFEDLGDFAKPMEVEKPLAFGKTVQPVEPNKFAAPDKFEEPEEFVELEEFEELEEFDELVEFEETKNLGDAKHIQESEILEATEDIQETGNLEETEDIEIANRPEEASVAEHKLHVAKVSEGPEVSKIPESSVSSIPLTTPEAPGVQRRQARNPLATATLAELYLSQGFLEKALNVYQDLLAGDPENLLYSLRCSELNAAREGQQETSSPAALASKPEIPAEKEKDAALKENAEGELGSCLENIRRRKDGL
jgi:tetratricopeptide (TPR) repeat protein